MINLILLAPLCIIFAGESNCEWEWEQIFDEDVFKDEFIDEHNSWAVGTVAFTDYKKRTVFFSSDFEDWYAEHEINHIKCFLQWDIDHEDAILDNCNDRVDDDYNVMQAREIEPPTPHTLQAIQEYHRVNTDDFWRYM
jgi:hypothetical protein